jgi:hypothetical protein
MHQLSPLLISALIRDAAFSDFTTGSGEQTSNEPLESRYQPYLESFRRGTAIMLRQLRWMRCLAAIALSQAGNLHCKAA